MTKKNFTISIAFLVIGCSVLIKPKVKFKLLNDSNYDISIRFYQKSKIIDSLEIKSKNQYFSRAFDSNKESTITPFNTNSDSIVIDFSKRKYLLQYCNGEKLHFNFDKCGAIPKSLMDFGMGIKSLNKFSENIIYTITFDNSDYNKANNM